eukprot:763727-Prorocentrum_minimum.AAC.1
MVGVTSDQQKDSDRPPPQIRVRRISDIRLGGCWGVGSRPHTRSTARVRSRRSDCAWRPYHSLGTAYETDVRNISQCRANRQWNRGREQSPGVMFSRAP